MGLWIEENLRVADPVGHRFPQVGHGEVVKILFGLQSLRSGIIQVQERLQIFKFIGLSNFFHALVGQGNAVFIRQGQHHLRFQRAFDVQVQFGLREIANKRINFHPAIHEKTGRPHKSFFAPLKNAFHIRAEWLSRPEYGEAYQN